MAPNLCGCARAEKDGNRGTLPRERKKKEEGPQRVTFSIRDTHKEEEENDVPLHKLLWEDAKRFSFLDLVRLLQLVASIKSDVVRSAWLTRMAHATVAQRYAGPALLGDGLLGVAALRERRFAQEQEELLHRRGDHHHCCCRHCVRRAARPCLASFLRSDFRLTYLFSLARSPRSWPSPRWCS